MWLNGVAVIFFCAFSNVYLRCILIWPPRAFHSATVERDRCKDVRSWIARTFGSALCCQDTGNNCNMGIRKSFFSFFFFPFLHNMLHWQHRVPVTTVNFFLSNCTRFSSYFKCHPNAFCRPLRATEMLPWGRRLRYAIGREQMQRNSAFAVHTSSLNPKTGLSGSVGFGLVCLCHKYGKSRSAKEVYITWTRSWSRGKFQYWIMSYFMIWLKITMIKMKMETGPACFT